MVTTFNKKDLVSFGKYLLSQEREEKLKASKKELPNSIPYEDAFREVYDSDVANWMHDNRDEKNVLKKMHEMCVESLDPESYYNWEKITKQLKFARKNLK